MKLNIIVAIEAGRRGIGFRNTMPWHFPEDLKKFSKVTKGQGNNAIIMGRKTWESLPIRPLPKRQNIILSRSLDDITLHDNELYFNDLKIAITVCKKMDIEEVWIIGGSQVYTEAINNLEIDEIHVTEIYKEYECDTFFPSIPHDFICTTEKEETYDDTMVIHKVFAKGGALQS